MPVFHDDQHGTAIVLLAGLMNAAGVVSRELTDLRVVINGAGAAGTAIAKLLRCVGQETDACIPVKEIVVCDSKGAIHRERGDLNPQKQQLLDYTNQNNHQGSLQDVLRDSDVFIGVSKCNLLNADDIRSMAADPIILAMANPIPEIMPDIAREAGAAVVGTGRSDFPNQVNNVLAFPGIFRGALDAEAPRITEGMKIAAARALASSVDSPSADEILPNPLDCSVAPRIAAAVAKAWNDSNHSTYV
ncbi:MAG: NAD-dependent malic enzyme [Verrucomicrobiota bacterium]